MDSLRTRFIKTYSSLPDNIRKEVIAVVDGDPYSWQAAYAEIQKGTKLGDKILTKMQELGLMTDE